MLHVLAWDRPLMINGSRHQNAPLSQVIRETQTLLSGRMFINPAGGVIGKRSDGRILI